MHSAKVINQSRHLQLIPWLSYCAPRNRASAFPSMNLPRTGMQGMFDLKKPLLLLLFLLLYIILSGIHPVIRYFWVVHLFLLTPWKTQNTPLRYQTTQHPCSQLSWQPLWIFSIIWSCLNSSCALRRFLGSPSQHLDALSCFFSWRIHRREQV